jgi:hypothetical protein
MQGWLGIPPLSGGKAILHDDGWHGIATREGNWPSLEEKQRTLKALWSIVAGLPRNPFVYSIH